MIAGRLEHQATRSLLAAWVVGVLMSIGFAEQSSTDQDSPPRSSSQVLLRILDLHEQLATDEGWAAVVEDFTAIHSPSGARGLANRGWTSLADR